ncbi:hypothetical protein [Sphingobium sp. YR657]|jgi:hypothetical protein
MGFPPHRHPGKGWDINAFLMACPEKKDVSLRWRDEDVDGVRA